MFTLAPATRWGYFVYPIGLVGWLLLTRPPAGEGSPIDLPVQSASEQALPAAAR
jgi:hypothetical protein